MTRGFVVLLGAAVAVGAADCGNPLKCSGVLVEKLSVPQSASVTVGSSFVATAGAVYGGCHNEPGSEPPRRFLGQASDSAVVSIYPLDSDQASIGGLAPGTTTVTPNYVTGGSVPSIHVTVVP